MGRSQGARNTDYEERRQELVKIMRARLGRAGAVRASWRKLAAAAGISLSTATHYFGNREAIVVAVLEEDRRTGEIPLAKLAAALPDLASSVRQALNQLYYGMSKGGLGEICTVGLIEGLRNETIGPAFLRSVLDPVLNALVTRLQKHQADGAMIACDPRLAAIQLLSPVLLNHLYMTELYGSRLQPSAAEGLLEEQVKSFLCSYSSKNLV